ncbi:MAG: S-methyl-5-thioribose-1-phosphate isomerase [Candidatus Aenigmatarchaeota archaeon]
MLVGDKHYRTVWMEGNIVRMINQIKLPHQFIIQDFLDYTQTALSIKDMYVRGAGAIGATAGYGIAQAALQAPDQRFHEYVNLAAEHIKQTRPTAQNLFYAVNRVLKKIENLEPAVARQEAVKEAQAIADDDANSCKKIGELGADLIKDGYKISTHCNAGWLAFVDWGSALSPIYQAKRQGKNVFVFVDETRPRSQGSKLTAWELVNEKIPHAVIVDNATGYYMKKGEIDLVIVGSDRIAINGDVANKIGTYSSAVVAKENNISFYVAAPTSTIDPNCPSGDQIPIEERHEDEVLVIEGLTVEGKEEKVRIAPKESCAKNPSFDVTPAKYITGIITEKGIFKPEELRNLF